MVPEDIMPHLQLLPRIRHSFISLISRYYSIGATVRRGQSVRLFPKALFVYLFICVIQRCVNHESIHLNDSETIPVPHLRF